VAKLKPEFDKRNVKVIAVSVDDVSSHKRWTNDIEETQHTKLNYPILGDPDRKVSTLYGMIHPNANDTLTVRSVFVIDPNKKVRLTITYPASTGRNFDEILRIIDSLQLTDSHSVATPANWKDGDDVIIVPSLQDPEIIKQKFPKGYKAVRPTCASPRSRTSSQNRTQEREAEPSPGISALPGQEPEDEEDGSRRADGEAHPPSKFSTREGRDGGERDGDLQSRDAPGKLMVQVQAVLRLFVPVVDGLFVFFGFAANLDSLDVFALCGSPPFGAQSRVRRQSRLRRINGPLDPFGLVVGPSVVGLRLMQDRVVLLDDGVVGVCAGLERGNRRDDGQDRSRKREPRQPTKLGRVLLLFLEAFFELLSLDSLFRHAWFSEGAIRTRAGTLTRASSLAFLVWARPVSYN
jgi:thioredoxin-dependent peroxiredoxin